MLRAKTPFAAIVLLACTAASAPAYHVATRIAGPDGGWDYASVDPAANRVFVARGDSVTVVDLAHPDAARSIGAIQRGHAVVPIPGGDLVLVTSGNDGTARLIDARSGTERARINVGQKPDAALLDPQTGHALVVNAKDGSISEIDLHTASVSRTIKLKPALEEAAIGNGRTLFVNNEDANEIETADLTSGAPGAAIPLPGCEGPTGLAYDAKTKTLISACANGKAAVVNAATRKLVKLVDIGRGPDGAMIDQSRRVALIPCGRDGVLEVLSLDGPGGVTRIASIKTETGARTAALNPSTGQVYLPTARFGPPASPGGRPTPVPGSFHILVVSPS